MATFNLSANVNIDALSGKGGGDIYNLLGYTLTIDQDSRVGTNQTTSTTLGTITVDAALGGVLKIDARAVRMIPYTGGSGNVPAWNTAITQSGQSGTGLLIGVHSALTAASTATGAAMPASGYIRIKQASGNFVGGTALTGIGATTAGDTGAGALTINVNSGTKTFTRTTGDYLADRFAVGDSVTTSGFTNGGNNGTFTITALTTTVMTFDAATGLVTESGDNNERAISQTAWDVGWLEVVGDEASTITANRLGSVEITGEWFLLGTTTGVSNQTLQAPSNGLLRYIAGVFIEQNAGAGDYEFYPNAGTTTTTGTEAARGKVVWIDNAGLVRIGNSGAGTNGYTPAAGLKVVCPNIFLENCTTAARTVNVIPNPLVASRYDFTCTGGGVVVIDKANSAWYWSFAQPYSVTLTNCCTIDAMTLSECASPVAWSKVGVGNKPTTALLTVALTMSLNYAGGTLTDCVFARVSQASSGSYTTSFADCSDFTFTRCRFRANTIRGNATTGAATLSRDTDFTFTDTQIIQGKFIFSTCNRITMTGTSYVDCVSGTTVSTYAHYVWDLATNTLNCTFSGLTLPVTNAHPYSALANIGATACESIKVRNIGTRTSPLSLGSATACGGVINFPAGASAKRIKVQRVYCSNTRLNGIYYVSATSPDNSSTEITLENVHTDYADNADLVKMLNLVRKGIGGIPDLTVQTSVYGTHWFDYFTGTSAGQLGLMMNEPTSLTTAQVTLAGGSAFTSAGGLYMPTIGHTATFETPDYLLGHTSFQDAVPVMAGGTIANYDIAYKIDKNDGGGFSASWKNLYYPRTGGGGSGGTYVITMTSTTGVNAGDRVTGTGVGAGAKVVTIDTGTQITVDVLNAGAVSGTLLFFAHSNETSISASLGFKMRWRITTSTTNTTAITSLYALTNSSAAAQDNQYPLDPVTVQATVKDAATSSAISGARILVEAAAGGDLPAGESVTTITRSGSTATVTHDLHGVPNNSTVIIRGANQPEYNGSHVVTFVDANTYTYTVSGTPATPATGSITSTSEILNGLSSASGIVSSTFAYTSSQPVVGKARKGTAAPFYRTAPISGTISSSGLDLTVFMVGDS